VGKKAPRALYLPEQFRPRRDGHFSARLHLQPLLRAGQAIRADGARDNVGGRKEGGKAL